MMVNDGVQDVNFIGNWTIENCDIDSFSVIFSFKFDRL